MLQHVRPKPSSLLSRLSDRTHKSPDATTQATSFVSARSAQKRDHAAEKWFTNVRQVNIDQPDGPKLLPRKSQPPKQRRTELRPRTDLNALFSPSATTLRIQTSKELGGDYTSYLPDGRADPHKLPVAYAHLFLGRNKHIPFNARTGALNVIQDAIQGKATRQVD